MSTYDTQPSHCLPPFVCSSHCRFLHFALPPPSAHIRTYICAAKTLPQNPATYAFHFYFTLLLTICTWMRIVAIVIACRNVVFLLTVKHIEICCTSPNVQVCDKGEEMWVNYVNGKCLQQSWQNVHATRTHMLTRMYKHIYIYCGESVEIMMWLAKISLHPVYMCWSSTHAHIKKIWENVINMNVLLSKWVATLFI